MKINAICGGIYASGIAGLSFLKKHSNILQKKHTNPRSEFFGKPFPNRPAKTLCCSPVTAVRPILYSNLQSDNAKFLHFVPFCFFRWRTAVSCFSSIDRFQLVCFAGGSLPPFFRGCPSPLSATPTFLPDPFVSFTDIFPRSGKSPTLWGITLAELSQLDRSRLRRTAVSRP